MILPSEPTSSISKPNSKKKTDKKESPKPQIELPPIEISEPPTTVNVITVSTEGIVKRTPRHLYTRQRRGGMGVFDLETSSNDCPHLLTTVDEANSLVILTSMARAFRLPINKLSESPVHARGEALNARIPLEPEEKIAAILPEQATGYVAMVSQSGMVRSLRHHLFGEYLRPGTSVYNYREFGPLAAACWTPGDADLVIATKKGLAIRFSEKLIPPQGIRGIRVEAGDQAVAITSVFSDSGVFFLGNDGKGTIRQMAAFNPNKSPGGSGKYAMKTDRLVTALTIDQVKDIFIISRLGKIIRFSSDEVPATEGVVQGVNCISLRGDECMAAMLSEQALS